MNYIFFKEVALLEFTKSFKSNTKPCFFDLKNLLEIKR